MKAVVGFNLPEMKVTFVFKEIGHNEKNDDHCIDGLSSLLVGYMGSKIKLSVPLKGILCAIIKYVPLNFHRH